MSEPSLPEFLLARYAEDEALWRLAADAELGFVAGKPGRISQHPMASVPPQSFGRRMLADVEGKRRIVEELGGLSLSLPTRGRAMNCLRYLAMPYADHPDFREEWKP